MDLNSTTLAGLAAVGVVNVVSFFKPTLDSRVKFALSVVTAFLIIALVPVSLGEKLFDQAKQALVIAFGMSGIYKIASKAGGQ